VFGQFFVLLIGCFIWLIINSIVIAALTTDVENIKYDLILIGIIGIQICVTRNVIEQINQHQLLI
jgi:hypothetical protein